MLVIRREQIEILGQHGRFLLEEKMLAHLQAHWTSNATVLGHHAARAYVRDIACRAQGHGFTTIYDVTRYLNLAEALGPQFDTDPRYPWARSLLSATYLEATDKMDRLCEWTTIILSAGPAHA